MGGSGRGSTAGWGVFLLDSSDDMGFLRNGRPFLDLDGGSSGGSGVASTRGPVLRLLDAAPDGWGSDDDENHEVLDCLLVVVVVVAVFGMVERDEKPVMMGGGGGLDRSSWFSGSWAAMMAAESGTWTSWAALRSSRFFRATPPMKPGFVLLSYAGRAGGGREGCDGVCVRTGEAGSCGANRRSEPVEATRTIGGRVGGCWAGGRASEFGETCWGGCGCGCGWSRCAAAGSQTEAGACSGRGEVGFDGARRWKRRCDSMLETGRAAQGVPR